MTTTRNEHLIVWGMADCCLVSRIYYYRTPESGKIYFCRNCGRFHEEEMQMAYWNDEEPQVKRVAGMELRYYPQAGKLQVYQQKEGSTHGVSKGIVIEVAKQGPSDLAELLVAIDGFFHDSVSEQVEREAWDQLVEEAHQA